ncbi:MAG: hypothetical protein LBN36_04745, partial [Clostridiales Family XIII bacterium]|nr:hypothetical protein [Clostridiales Family XIII bacterium]
ALLHDHPVEAHSHSSGVTSFGQTVTIKIKGYFADVTSVELGGAVYTLGPVDTGGPAPTRALLRGGTAVGQLSEGSAVVTFPAATIDALANGTYPLVVTFVDNIGTGYSVSSAVANSEIRIDRAASGGGGIGGGPRTGDDFNLALWLSLLCLALLLGVRAFAGGGWRRRQFKGRR